MIWFLILVLFCFSWLAAENLWNRHCLRSFRHVIHVNGIRGKTETCRLLDAALRSRYRVFTKTTGTAACCLHTDGSERPIRRLGPANIGEQLRVIRQAHREGAQILVLECMAVAPELQKTAQQQIVRSDISVITNVRYDHILEMGDSPEEIAASLAAVIPDHGLLYTAEPRAREFWPALCEQAGTRLICTAPDFPAEGTPFHPENLALARKISEDLGISSEEFRTALPLVKSDFGTRKLYSISSGGGSFYFLNLFSANDPQSAESLLQQTLAQLGSVSGLYFLYNHRPDRPDRALLFARYFSPGHPGCTLWVWGSGAPLPCRLFVREGWKDVRRWKKKDSLPELPKGSLLVGIGNIKGNPCSLLEKLDKECEP